MALHFSEHELNLVSRKKFDAFLQHVIGMGRSKCLPHVAHHLIDEHRSLRWASHLECSLHHSAASGGGGHGPGHAHHDVQHLFPRSRILEANQELVTNLRLGFAGQLGVAFMAAFSSFLVPRHLLRVSKRAVGSKDPSW